ncbi:MAG: hypothetical protein D6758_04745, partial [Gammaproteobacteria bacterium]
MQKMGLVVRRRVARFVWGLILTLACLTARGGELGFYYGQRLDPGEWQHLEYLVLQPEHTPERPLRLLKKAGVKPLAYISVGEVAREAGYFDLIPDGALLSD